MRRIPSRASILTRPDSTNKTGAVSESELDKQLREIEKAAQQQAAQDAALFGGSAAAPPPRPPPPPPRPAAGGPLLKPPVRRDGQFGYKEVRILNGMTRMPAWGAGLG